MQNGATRTPRPPLAARKRLPWLDAAGIAPALHPQPTSTSHDLLPPQAAPSNFVEPSTKYVASNALSDDLRFRPTGSTPEIRDQRRTRDPRSYSQTSERPAGLRSRPITKSKPAPDHRALSCASSEYSTTTPSDREALPAGFPRKDPASYEKLVRSPHSPDSASKKPAIRIVTPSTDTVKAQPARQLKGTTKRKPHPSLYRNVAAVSSASVDGAQRKLPGAISNAATDAEASSATLPRPTAQDLPLSSVPATTSSLYALPPHLMAPSSSSSPDSDHAMPTGISRKAAAMPDRQNFAGGKSKPPADAATGPAQDGPRDLQPLRVGTAAKGATRAVTGLPDLQEATVRPLRLSQTESMRSSEGEGISPFAHVNQAMTKARSPNSQPAPKEPARISRGGDAQQRHRMASADDSISRTPPRLYHPPSADSIVRDYAYGNPKIMRRHSTHSLERAKYGAAASFYGDHGESVATQPGVRHSICTTKIDAPLPPSPAPKWCCGRPGKQQRVHRAHVMHNSDTTASRVPSRPLRRAQAGLQNGSRSAEPLLAADDQVHTIAAANPPSATGTASATLPTETFKPARVPTVSSDAEAV